MTVGDQEDSIWGGKSFKISRMSCSETSEKEERGESPTKTVSDGGLGELESRSFRMAAIFSEKKMQKVSGSLSQGMFKGKTVVSPTFPNNSFAM